MTKNKLNKLIREELRVVLAEIVEKENKDIRDDVDRLKEDLGYECPPYTILGLAGIGMVEKRRPEPSISEKLDMLISHLGLELKTSPPEKKYFAKIKEKKS